jgi:hypothetical protein
MLDVCSAHVPCEALRRKTRISDSKRPRRHFEELEAGPRVAIILVFNTVRLNSGYPDGNRGDIYSCEGEKRSREPLWEKGLHRSFSSRFPGSAPFSSWTTQVRARSPAPPFLSTKLRLQLPPAISDRQCSAAASSVVPLKKSGLFAVQNEIAFSNNNARSDFSSITPCSTSS